jgi:hypothetical protein
MTATDDKSGQIPKAEIHTYQSDHLVYAMNWSVSIEYACSDCDYCTTA